MVRLTTSQQQVEDRRRVVVNQAELHVRDAGAGDE